MTLIAASLLHKDMLNLAWEFPSSIADVTSSCFPPFSPPGGTSCREVLGDDADKMKILLTRIRFLFGPLYLWYIRKGIRLVCPAECEYENKRFLRWRNAPENKGRLNVAGKDMETKRQILNEINDKKREMIPSGTDGELTPDNPASKKRMTLWLYTTLHIFMMIFVIGWSRWQVLQTGNTMMFLLIGLKVARIPYEIWLRKSLREYWVMSAFLCVWQCMEFLVMIGAPKLTLFLLLFSFSSIFDCLRRIFIEPILIRASQFSMGGRRKKVHSREQFDILFRDRHQSGSTWLRDVICGMRSVSGSVARKGEGQRVHEGIVRDTWRKWQKISGKEGTLRDMVSSGVNFMSSLHSVFIVGLMFILYDELAVFSLYGIFQVNLLPYFWCALIFLVCGCVNDYLTTNITEVMDSNRNRMKHLRRISPNGFLWQRDIWSFSVDLRIDDSLRSLDTLSFSFQYFYGVLMMTTGMVLGYLFIFAFFSVADSSSSSNLLNSLLAPFFDVITIFVWIVTRVFLGKVWPVIENMVVGSLVDMRTEEVAGTESLGSQMRNKYRRICAIAMREEWSQQQFIDSIKEATDELIKSENIKQKRLEAGGKDADEETPGMSHADVEEIIIPRGAPQDEKKKALSNQVLDLLSHTSTASRSLFHRLGPDSEASMFILPPEMDSPDSREAWRRDLHVHVRKAEAKRVGHKA